MTLANRAISSARSLWYSITEPLKLKALRLWEEDTYDPDTFLYNPNPLISVYVPTFNRCDLLLTRALASISRQTYPNYEVIVAAHGCADGTLDAMRQLAATGSVACGTRVENGHTFQRRVSFVNSIRVRVIEVPRTQTYPPTARNHWLAGPVAPANAALRECRGAYIARCDDDDEWTPDHLEKLLCFAQDHNLEFVTSAHTQIDSDGEKVVEPYRFNGRRMGGIQTSLMRSYLRLFRFNPDCWRKSWNAVNDVDWMNRIAFAGVRTGYLEDSTAIVRARPNEKQVGLKAYLNSERDVETRYAF